MFTTMIYAFIAITLFGLCMTQLEATDRELEFLIKYHDIFNDSTH
ncbi:MAG: hypothetical protein ABIJ65_11920 [Chloroflexota bacterium]